MRPLSWFRRLTSGGAGQKGDPLLTCPVCSKLLVLKRTKGGRRLLTITEYNAIVFSAAPSRATPPPSPTGSEDTEPGTGGRSGRLSSSSRSSPANPHGGP